MNIIERNWSAVVDGIRLGLWAAALIVAGGQS